MVNQVGVITYALNRNPGGIARYTRQLLTAFSSLGFQPLILRSGSSIPGHRSVRLVGSELLPVLITLGQVEIGLYSRRCRLRLLHDPTGSALMHLSPHQRVLTIHDAVPFACPGRSTTLDRMIYRYWLPYAARGVDQILTDSISSKEDLARYLGVPMEKITVIPLAVGKQFRPLPEAEYKPRLERLGIRFPYILYVGSLEPRKNIERLLEAFTLLLGWSSKWHLVLAGAHNAWNSEPLEAYVDQRNLGQLVHFTGFIPDDELQAVYCGADLFTFPSLYEGFGLPVLEAMACGTPVVTSNCSSLPEVAGDAALLVDPYNTQEIADAIKLILSDREFASELSRRGLKWSKKFTWESTASQTLAVYEQLLGSSLI